MSTHYQTIFIDNDGTKWEAIPTNKAKNRNFDIYKNGIMQDYGAKKPWDIEPTIELLKENEKEAANFLKEIEANKNE